MIYGRGWCRGSCKSLYHTETYFIRLSQPKKKAAEGVIFVCAKERERVNDPSEWDLEEDN